MGRLGDGPRRREALLGGLGVVAIGGVVSALAPGFGWLLVGRSLLGIGLGLVPLTMAAARDGLPKERVQPTIAVLSVCAAAGVGAGYPISGLIADAWGLSGAFWFGTIFSVAALVCVAAVVPSSGHLQRTKLDAPGIALLTVGLVTLLLAIAQGASWGWGSLAVLGLLAISVIVLALWALHELRTPAPLVELRLLRRPAVLTGDVCATVLGAAMYMNLSVITEFVQLPRGIGFGFSASVVVAGLCLIPLSIFSLSASRVLPGLTRLFGSRLLLVAGSLIVAAGAGFFALFHTQLWQAFAMMAILGMGLGLTFAAIPGLIVRAIPHEETGSAMGFYQVVRYVGFSLGSALTATLLASHTAAGASHPAESGYTIVLWASVAVSVLAAGLAAVLPARAAAPARRPAPDLVELATDQWELSAAPD
jgi:predicted MFS family arabinose efflux permease